MNLMTLGETIAKTPGFVLGSRSSFKIPSLGKFRAGMLVFAFAALLLANVVSGAPLSHVADAQAVDSSIDYPENGTRPVGTFHAYDQDGDAIEWSLSGPDASLFGIDGGVLTFRDPPDFEDPRSAASTDGPEGRNLYRVTIEASGGTHDVAVTVTDVDEAGTVSIDRPQPQVDRPLGASFSDEDAGLTDKRWQWARSGERSVWRDIEGATSQQLTPVPADTGMYLRATVTYADKFGANKTASGVSARRVEARTLSNAAPSFGHQDEDRDTPYIDITRSVAENTAAGTILAGSVSATDADEDVLFYELLETPDLKDEDGQWRFTIDSVTGHIRIGKVLGADVGEREDEDSTSLSGGPELPDEDAGVAGNGKYVLRVKVSDPSTASATVNVVVTVTGVNEAPRFDADPSRDGIQKPPAELSVTEGDADKTLRAGTPPVALQGSTYAVTDEDAEDDPPQTGAYSLEGADRDSFLISGQGSLSIADSHTPDFERQSSYSITIVARSGEDSRRLTTTLDVTIGVENGEDPGELSLSQREPREGVEVYAAVADPDGGVTIKGWEWERSEVTIDEDGALTAACRSDPATPGIGVVTVWTPIDGAESAAYTPKAGDVGRCLRATATYADSIGADGDQAVQTSEAPVQEDSPANAAPTFVDQDLSALGGQLARTSRRVPENTEAGQSIGAPVSAYDHDGDLLIHTLGGPDAESFDIDRNSGQLKTKAPLDHEARSRYTVMTTATDPSGASTGITVTIFVTDEDDPAEISARSAVDFAENGARPVAVFIARDQDGGFIRWSLGGRDADLFTIFGGVLSFRQPPNHEAPLTPLADVSLELGNVYEVTVQASGGVQDVSVTVTDVDEAGTVTINMPQPQVSRPLEVTLSDDDEVVGGEMWQWARSADRTTWTEIDGATSVKRSPTPEDEGMYLRATVTYSDRFGTGKTASAVSARRVEARTLSNAAPSFVEQDGDAETAYIDIFLSVAENSPVGTAIGDPVSATDADEDILFYELLETPDLMGDNGRALFSIDSLSGQIRVGKALGADLGETEDEDSRDLTAVLGLTSDEDPGEAVNSEYVLRVKVSDPSTASATLNVIVTVTNVNEAPQFRKDAPTELSVAEDDTGKSLRAGTPPVELQGSTYTVTDEDAEDNPPQTGAYSVEGADKDSFRISGDGSLSVAASDTPDYEKQSSYSITIVARSGEGSRSMTATLDVTVEVVDGEDPGELTLSQRQPQLGIEIYATVSDPDGGVIIASWGWDRSEETTSDNCLHAGARRRNHTSAGIRAE